MPIGRVGVTWRVRSRPLSDRAVRKAVRAALVHGGRRKIPVDVVLAGDRLLADLHRRYLRDPSVTDVIAFDLGEGGGGPAGEIYANVSCARRVARRRGVRASRELALYLVHGALHLCGHDDRDPVSRRRMRTAESVVLAGLGYRPDPRAHS